MFSRDIEYTDLKGRKRNRRLTFNLTAPEAMRLEFKFDEGFEQYLKTAVEEDDRRKLFQLFELLISVSYGRLNADESELIKDPEWLKELMNSKYYEEFFFWLWNGENAAAFFRNIVPKDLESRMAVLNGGKAPEKKSAVDYTEDELRAMLAQLQNKTPAASVE